MNSKLAEFKIKYEDLYNSLSIENKKIVDELLLKYKIDFVEYIINHLSIYKCLDQQNIDYISDLDIYFDNYIIEDSFGSNFNTSTRKYFLGIKGSVRFYLIVEHQGNYICNVYILKEEDQYNNNIFNGEIYNVR